MIFDAEKSRMWNSLVKQLNNTFDSDLNIDGIIFLIGVQELGKGFMDFSKDQKIEVMHIALCTILCPYGYYEYEGVDDEGWPHWKIKIELPHLKPMEQEEFIKKAIMDYFERKDKLN